MCVCLVRRIQERKVFTPHMNTMLTGQLAIVELNDPTLTDRWLCLPQSIPRRWRVTELQKAPILSGSRVTRTCYPQVRRVQHESKCCVHKEEFVVCGVVFSPPFFNERKNDPIPFADVFLCCWCCKWKFYLRSQPSAVSRGCISCRWRLLQLLLSTHPITDPLINGHRDCEHIEAVNHVSGLQTAYHGHRENIEAMHHVTGLQNHSLPDTGTAIPSRLYATWPVRTPC